MYIHLHIYTHAYEYIYTCTHINTQYTHIYMYMHTYIYTYTYIWVFSLHSHLWINCAQCTQVAKGSIGLCEGSYEIDLGAMNRTQVLWKKCQCFNFWVISVAHSSRWNQICIIIVNKSLYAYLPSLSLLQLYCCYALNDGFSTLNIILLWLLCFKRNIYSLCI